MGRIKDYTFREYEEQEVKFGIQIATLGSVVLLIVNFFRDNVTTNVLNVLLLSSISIIVSATFRILGGLRFKDAQNSLFSRGQWVIFHALKRHLFEIGVILLLFGVLGIFIQTFHLEVFGFKIF